MRLPRVSCPHRLSGMDFGPICLPWKRGAARRGRCSMPGQQGSQVTQLPCPPRLTEDEHQMQIRMTRLGIFLCPQSQGWARLRPVH
jgi:hypothetical protein